MLNETNPIIPIVLLHSSHLPMHTYIVECAANKPFNYKRVHNHFSSDPLIHISKHSHIRFFRSNTPKIIYANRISLHVQFAKPTLSNKNNLNSEAISAVLTSLCIATKKRASFLVFNMPSAAHYSLYD